MAYSIITFGIRDWFLIKVEQQELFLSIEALKDLLGFSFLLNGKSCELYEVDKNALFWRFIFLNFS